VDGAEDEVLMLQVAKGDRVSFARLFDRHQLSVVRFCQKFVPSRDRAEELAQDVFVKLFRSAHRYRPEAKFKTFLFRVASNHCLNELRRGEYRLEQHDAEGPVDSPDRSPVMSAPSLEGSPEEQAQGRELELAVQQALRGMSDRERAAFSMCRFEGMAYREIAFALEASEAAVKSLIHRATLAVAKKVEALQAGQLSLRSGS
jgi:RNA polymerase sigma-70 factor, ECF subfamily